MPEHDERSLGSESLSDHNNTPQRSSAEDSSAWTENFEASKAQNVDDAEEDLGRLNYLWVLISCGYMVSWTSIGSLISFFKEKQGASFYVQFYCAFYLPGLPMSLLQQRWDPAMDAYFGSKNAFTLRVLGGMAVKVLLLVYMPFIPYLYAEAAVPNVMLLCMVAMGAGTWMIHGTASQLCSMFPRSSMAYLQTGFRTPEIYTVAMVSLLHLGGNATRAHLMAFYFATAAVALVGAGSWWAVCRSPRAIACFAQKDADSLLAARSREASARPPPGPSEDDERASLLQKGSSLANGLYTTGGGGGHRGGGEAGGENETPECVAARIYPCRLAIFLNIWSSIFSAGFFAYVKPAGRVDTELVLYFVRLFSDLVGRPLTRLPRPRWLATKRQLVRVAYLRLTLMGAFFAYIALGWQSDALVVSVVAVFSVLSGYLSVLSYEYAAASVHTKAGQASSGALMNTTFQMAAFSAVIMGVLVSMSGIMPEPADSGAQKRAGIGEVGIVDQGDVSNGFWPVSYDDDAAREIELEHDDGLGAAFRW